MTRLKTTLIASAIALSFAAAPASAGHHEGDMKTDSMMMEKEAMTMDEKKMKWQAMSAEERKAKIQNMSVEEHMKWQAMSDTEKQTMMSWMSEDEKMMFKAAKKKHKMMHHDGSMKSDAMMKDDKMMKSDTMMKNDKMMATQMTIEQRRSAEARILNAMTPEQRQKFAAMSPEARKAMMNKKISGDYMAHDSMIKDKRMMQNGTIGEVMQDDAHQGVNQRRSIAVPTVNSNVATSVNCPSGTTAQPNGTCLITGNYNYKS